ncbi:hypothetical protein [Sinorhizobium meliloti]|uniref:hypothetical protein n=1 Tax=Rhizobium meliloti TaxID=382 RepID=UPI000486E4E4|nr:hypothetical protein [Sinorhizobium meliloti]
MNTLKGVSIFGVLPACGLLSNVYAQEGDTLTAIPLDRTAPEVIPISVKHRQPVSGVTASGIARPRSVRRISVCKNGRIKFNAEFVKAVERLIEFSIRAKTKSFHGSLRLGARYFPDA